MKYNNKSASRALAFLLALCLSLTCLPPTIAAATDSGNDLASIASSQVGTLGGTKYRTWFYGKDNNYNWCAIFVSWCANQAGISTKIIPKSAGCGTMYTGILNGGGQVVSAPKDGDIVFYYDNENRCYAHVGIMINNSESVQGNLGSPSQVKKLNKVTNYRLSSKTCKDTQNYSVTYVRPNYGNSTSTSEPGLETSISPSVFTNSASNITPTSAQLNGSLKISAGTGHITEHGAYLGTSTSNMTLVAKDTVNYNKSSLTTFYSTSKYGTTLEPGTTYYYRCYAVVNGETISGETVSFKTDDAPVVDVTVITNSASNVSKTSAQLNGSLRASANVNITEHGAYLGTSTSNMTLVAKDTVNYNKSSLTTFYNTSKYGTTLEPGTTYYYRCYAVVDGKTISGETVSFKTDDDVIIDQWPTAKVTTNPASNIGETSAQLNGSIWASENVSITEHGAYLGASTSDMVLVARDVVNYNKSSLRTFYNTSKYGATLEPDTTYYYYCYAVINGQTVNGDIVSFKTNPASKPTPPSPTLPSPTPPSGPEVPTPSVFVTTNSVSNVTTTSAQLNASLRASETVNITEHGAYLGTSTSDMQLVARDVVNHNKSSLTMFYSMAKYGTTLQPGTTYYYYCYAVVNGKEYRGDVISFTTNSQVVSNTRIGVVSGTDGRYLAINDSPGASPTYSNKIGRVPPGEQLTVYPDKKSGNWYYVEYNGVSGYAYSKYVSLQ